MAAKTPKNGTGKPAAPKAPAKAAPKPKAVVVAAKKAAPVVEAEIVAPLAPEPAPVAEVVPQETVPTAEAETLGVVEAEALPVETPVVVPEPLVEQVEAAARETIIETVAAVEAVTETIKETKVMETIETNFAKAQAFFADFNDKAKAAVEKSTKFVGEANEFAKGNLEAVVESGKITAKGLEVIGQDAADYSRKSFETVTATLKSLAAVKTPTDFFKLQSDFVRSSFDSVVAQTSKNTEAFIKLAGDAAQPLSNRVALAAEKVKLAA